MSECHLTGEQTMIYSYFSVLNKKVRKRFWSLVKVKAVYYHPAYLTCMQSTSCEMPGWMKHKVEPRLLGEISIISDMQMTPAL